MKACHPALIDDATRTLWAMRRGQQAWIEAFDDGLDPAYRVRLSELGFHPGERVTCLLSPAFGAPKVYRVANTMFSLDRELAGFVRICRDE